MPDLRLASRLRRAPLSNAETVKIGRLLVEALPASHISYPDEPGTVTIVVHGFAGPLPEQVSTKLTEFIGAFDLTVDPTP